MNDRRRSLYDFVQVDDQKYDDHREMENKCRKDKGVHLHPLRLVIKPILVAGESNRRLPALLPWYHDDNQGVFVFSVGGVERGRQFPVVTVNGNILALGLSDTI